MNWRPAKPEDLETVLQNPKQKGLKHLTMPDEAWACEDNGRVVGVGGIVIPWPGVGEAWIVITDGHDPRYGAQIYWSLMEQLESVVAAKKLWRVEAQVRTDFPDALRTVMLAGFEQEGVRRHFAPDGMDMILFAKVYNEYLPWRV